MKNPIIISALILLTIGCRKDPRPHFYVNCKEEINSSSTAYFLEDAEILTYKKIQEDSSHSGYNQVELETYTREFYLGKLSAIYNASLNSTGSLNEMLNKWEIHVGPHYLMNQLYIRFIESSNLKSELLNDPGNTSNDFLNELYNKYGFSYISEIWYDSSQVFIKTLNNYNVRYIKEQLLLSPEITSVYLNAYFLDGPTIEHEEYADHDIFLFSYAWGDCPSGCIGRHYWKVKVDDDCIVTLEEEYGDELPW